MDGDDTAASGGDGNAGGGGENKLGILEFIHAFVETLDKYFEGICELDIRLNLEKAHIMHEMVVNGPTFSNVFISWRRLVQARSPFSREEGEEVKDRNCTKPCTEIERIQSKHICGIDQ